MERDLRQRAERVRLAEIRLRMSSLTPREREVLEHVLQGQRNKQIARELDIHERTVKLHRTNIATKLRVNSVAVMTRLAHEAGTLPGRPTPVRMEPRRPAPLSPKMK
jgi:FixJ family two-component response regulator